MRTDTIAAIASALSDSGIGIIRVSGPDSLSIGDRCFRSPSGKCICKNVESHTVHYGYVIDEPDAPDWKNHVVDEVMLTVFRAPRSYTTEDTVEISCHGGVVVMQRVLEILLRNGARLAEPGEFTRRAFLNGRIDLSRAEAVMDVIHSQNEYALSASMDQLQGKLAITVKSLRERLLYEIAFIESALDDPEHFDLDEYPSHLSNQLAIIENELSKLIQSASDGRLVKEGISTVIVGKPNAGKSSLLNMILGEERAIVTDVAGTTRDILREQVNLQGITLNIVDTAGIRDTSDAVEQIGVERAIAYAEKADLILCVVDASVPLESADFEIFQLIDGKKAIVLLNKSDLQSVVQEEDLKERIHILQNHNDICVIRTSTVDNTGFDEMNQTIREMFFTGSFHQNGEVVITNLRHKEALQEAYDSLLMVEESIRNGMPEDFYSIDLTNAYAALGRIIGEEVDDDVVEEIFAKFCMGK